METFTTSDYGSGDEFTVESTTEEFGQFTTVDYTTAEPLMTTTAPENVTEPAGTVTLSTFRLPLENNGNLTFGWSHRLLS